jgi:hypothetical protein
MCICWFCYVILNYFPSPTVCLFVALYKQSPYSVSYWGSAVDLVFLQQFGKKTKSTAKDAME